MNVPPRFRHAITPIDFSDSMLHRERLVDRIHAELPRKLIHITAPPGYGKSLLLADFHAHTSLPVCWARLSQADRDVIRFASLMAASLLSRFRRLHGALDPDRFMGSAPEGLARAFAEVLEEGADRPFLFILDDLHHVNASAPVLTFLDSLLQIQPEHMTLLIASRELPNLSLAKLVVDAQVAGIGQHALALTPDELADFLDQRIQPALDQTTLNRLHQETQGWITGVILSALSERADLGLRSPEHPLVYEYFTQVVLESQSAEVRRFMLQSAVLPVMTESSANLILDFSESGPILRKLVSQGLFITATDLQPATYEYHPLFRQFLLQTLERQDPGRLKELQLRAADQLAAEGLPEESFQLYLDAGASEQAARLAEERARWLFESGYVHTLETWGDQLQALGNHVPELFLYLAIARSDRGELEAAQSTLDRAESMLRALGGTGEAMAKAKSVAAMLALERGDYAQVIRLVDESEAMSTDNPSPRRRARNLRYKALALFHAGEDLSSAQSLAQEAVVLLEDGEEDYVLSQTLASLALILDALGEAEASYQANRRAHQVLSGIGAPLPLAISYNNLAVHAHRQGRYDEALALFSEGLKHARRAASARYEASIRYGQADVFCDLGLHFQAAELYDQGLRLAGQVGNPDLLRYGYLQISVLHRRAQSQKMAEEWLRRAKKVDSGPASPALELQAAALEAQTAPDEAQRKLIHLGDVRLHARDQTLQAFYLTQLCLVQGRRDAARQFLQESLRHAEQFGTHQILAAEGMYSPEILEFARSELNGDPGLSRVLGRIELMKSVAEYYAKSEAAEAPTPPELQIRALGRPGITRGGEAVSSLEPQPRQILFFLADRGPVDRDVLLETFWPDAKPGKQTSSLYTAVHSIRRALGKGAIDIDGSRYGLSPSLMLHFDVEQFERAADRAESLPPGDPRRYFDLTRALQLYAGPFLPEYASNWVITRRRELETRYVDLQLALAASALEGGHGDDALRSFRAALDLEPLRDDINIGYLKALRQMNRRSEAIAHYHRYVGRLRDELGLDPPEEARRLYDDLID